MERPEKLRARVIFHVTRFDVREAVDEDDYKLADSSKPVDTNLEKKKLDLISVRAR